MKDKKTALDLACRIIFNRAGSISCTLCIEGSKKPDCDQDCIEHLKQYFQQQADIPDGWDVVKEIYEQVKEDKYFNADYQQIGNSKSAYNECENLIIYIKWKLRQAGIEVSDE